MPTILYNLHLGLYYTNKLSSTVEKKSWIVKREHPSYQYGGDKLVEEDELDAAHRQRDARVDLRHVQIGISFRRIRVVHHAEVKHLLVCYRNSLTERRQQNENENNVRIKQ